MSGLLAALALTAGALSAAPADLDEAVQVLTSREGDVRGAREALLGWIRADLHGAEGIAAATRVLGGLDATADRLLAKELVEALPGEERMAGLLTALAGAGVSAESAGAVAADAIIERAGGSENPAYLRALLVHLDAVSRRDGTPVGGGYDALLKNFAGEPRVVAFVWTHPVPGPDTARRETLIDMLSAVTYESAYEHLREALTSDDVATRAVALTVAAARGQKVRAALIASLREIVTKGLAREEGLEPTAHLARLAAEGDREAFAALLDAFMSGGDDAEVAFEDLLALLEFDALPVDPTQLGALVKRVEGEDPSYDVFDLLELLDVTPVAARLVALLGEEDRGIAAAYALMGRTPDATVADLVAGLGKEPAPARVALLQVARDRYQGQPWGRGALALLTDEDEEVAQAAMALLIASRDPEVQTRLKAIDRGELLRLSSPYVAVTGGLQVRWSLSGSPSVERGHALAAEVVVTNAGNLPFAWPLRLPYRYTRWELAAGTAALGPLELRPKGGDAPTVLYPGDTATFTVALGRALAAVGDGTHRTRIQVASRARHARQRHAPDFVRAGSSRDVRVTEPRNVRTWLQSPAGATAWIEADGDAWRETGWKRWVSGYAGAEAAPEDPLAEVVAKMAKTGKAPKRGSLSVRIESQARVTQAIEIDARGKVLYTRAIEGPGGTAKLKVNAADRKAFFAALAAGRPFDHEPVQQLGRLRDPQITVRLTRGSETWTSPALWQSEVEHHPALVPWWEMLAAWKAQAEE